MFLSIAAVGCTFLLDVADINIDIDLGHPDAIEIPPADPPGVITLRWRRPLPISPSCPEVARCQLRISVWRPIHFAIR